MKKKTFLFVLVSNLFFSQIGINTNSPNATLDIAGKPSDETVPDGIIAPRLTLEQLNKKSDAYNNDQTGAIAYVTEISALTTPSDKVKYVTIPGYYVFNGIEWENLEPQTNLVFFQAKAEPSDGVEIDRTMFKTVKLTEVTNVGEGSWDAVNSTYKIPYSGTYVVTARIRPVNGTPQYDIFIDAGFENADSARGLWGTPTGDKYTHSYFRTLYLKKDEEIRLVTYFDSPPDVNLHIESATLSLTLLSTVGEVNSSRIIMTDLPNTNNE